MNIVISWYINNPASITKFPGVVTYMLEMCKVKMRTVQTMDYLETDAVNVKLLLHNTLGGAYYLTKPYSGYWFDSGTLAL